MGWGELGIDILVGMGIMGGMKNRYVLVNGEGEYYTVRGWTSSTTRYLSSAVIFPNEMLSEPKEGWKRVRVSWDGSFAKLLTN